MAPPDGPFVLLDCPAGARLFSRLVAIVETREPAEIRACLDQVRAAAGRGFHAAGFIGYEAGLALEPKLVPLASTPDTAAPPLLWFGLFEAAEAVDTDLWLPDPTGAWCGPARPRIDRAAYLAAADRAVAHIFAGDIYQTNLTFHAEARVAGSPLALYAGVRVRGGGRHGGIVFTGAHWLLSCSPELFFTLEGRHVTARPMKGTAVRRADPAADAAEATLLQADPKQRAENLMIVDLLRNDLARVAAPGTVAVPHLFEIETYPTVHQMTSTVTAELAPGLDTIDLIAAAFPCGSVTGVPKIRAMEIIAALEPDARGPYTGSIGMIAPGGAASFNVAIRTLVLAAGDTVATLGLGSAVVADSRPEDEWRECIAKGAFVADRRPLDLLETMRFDPLEGLADLERHLARIKASAEALDFAFDRHDARNELQAATFRLRSASVVRLRLSRSGAIAIATRAAPAPPHGPVAVAVVPLPVDPADFRLRHKTGDRDFYDAARRAAGTFEVLFESGGALTEGSFTNLFVERGGRLVTPPLSRGLLPGILRERLLEEGRAVEGELTRADLANGFLIGNALRGLMPARLASGCAHHT